MESHYETWKFSCIRAVTFSIFLLCAGETARRPAGVAVPGHTGGASLSGTEGRQAGSAGCRDVGGAGCRAIGYGGGSKAGRSG
jgi:hypothetical protein